MAGASSNPLTRTVSFTASTSSATVYGMSIRYTLALLNSRLMWSVRRKMAWPWLVG